MSYVRIEKMDAHITALLLGEIVVSRHERRIGGIQRSMLSLIFALGLIANTCVAQPTQSATAEQQLHTWLSLFNEGDANKLREFQQKNNADPADHVADDLRFRDMTGGFELKKIDACTPMQCVALLKEKESDTFARATLELQDGEPHKIKSLQISMTDPPAEFRVKPMPERDAIAATKKYLEQNAAADKFAGAIAIAQRGAIRFQHAYGLADRPRKIPNTVDTQFRIGSMNKMFTATAILQLDQAGKLKLSDPVGKYLTDYPNKDIATKVTLHQLLTHTGGTGDIFGPEFDKNRLDLKTLQDYVKLYGQRGPTFEPGSKWDYSNYGFLLLGVVIEKASGTDYYAYVRDNIFKPAGMTSSDSLPEDQRLPKRANGYMKSDNGGRWIPNTDTLPYRGTSAGGGYTTVGDLIKFANALSTNKLLDARHAELLTKGQVDTPMGSKYAYGFMDNRANTPAWFGHGGGAPGMNGELRIFPQSGYVVAVLSNLDPPAAERVASYVGNRLPEN